MRILTLIILAAFVIEAHAASAFFTGRQQQVTTVTYKMVWQCEYNFNGQKFWRLFENFCPAMIEVM